MLKCTEKSRIRKIKSRMCIMLCAKNKHSYYVNVCTESNLVGLLLTLSET